MIRSDLVVKMFMGHPFVTDDLRIKDWLEKEKVQTHESFERAFPGFIACCRKAIRGLEKDKVPVARLEYIKGKISAHSPKEFAHAPSEAFIFLMERTS